MAPTILLRAQVSAAQAMLDRISVAIEIYSDHASAYPLALDLSRLAGVLRIHFSLGDRHLYPFLLASGQEETVAIAHGFQREIRHLGLCYDRFMQRWSSSRAIASSLPQFRREAEVMLTALDDRLKREIRDLLPLAEALAGPTTLRAA